jgi:Cu(I)/Ag(I) efflux system membrane fusion protein
MAIVRWVILVLAILAAATGWSMFLGGGHTISASAIKYQCPMHPQIVQDAPGECPICHMTLEPISAERLAHPAASHAGAHEPGQTPAASAGPARGSPPAETGSVPPGTTPIKLALDRVQAIGVRTALVTERQSSSGLRATATVAAPEGNVVEVHVRTPGFVEAISVRETGVKRGQLLLSLYSPEVYQAESELLTMKSWQGSSDAGAHDRTDLSRRKLDLLGVPGGVSDRVLAAGKPMRNVGISAPMGGYVTKKNVVLGSYVTPEMLLYEIVDLSRVYILAEVFQQDAPRIALGTQGRFTLANRPGVVVVAKVDLIYPLVNAEARTTRVRMQVPNEKLGLLPGEYGYVEFSSGERTALVVPRDAVIDTGQQAYVFVETAAGEFSPRTVVLAAQSGDAVEIRSGVSPGEKVVSGATFLIDSESRLQASLRSGPEAPSAAPSSVCDTEFDRSKFPDKYSECRKCETVHRGMGSMVDDCKRAIVQPWR